MWPLRFSFDFRIDQVRHSSIDWLTDGPRAIKQKSLHSPDKMTMGLTNIVLCLIVTCKLYLVPNWLQFDFFVKCESIETVQKLLRSKSDFPTGKRVVKVPEHTSDGSRGKSPTPQKVKFAKRKLPSRSTVQQQVESKLAADLPSIHAQRPARTRKERVSILLWPELKEKQITWCWAISRQVTEAVQRPTQRRK